LQGHPFPYNKYNNVQSIDIAIQNRYRSKFFTGDIETTIKRIRNVLLNIFSKGQIKIRGISIPIVDYDERIDNLTYNPTMQEYIYNPSVPNVHPTWLNLQVATDQNILIFIPPSPESFWSIQNNPPIQGRLDWIGKPIRFSIEIDSELRTQLNELAIHLRPIHTYLM
jgi:hypothetical protein